MKNRRKVDRIVIQKIIEYCNEIEEHMNRVSATYETYLSDKMFRRAVDMCVLQIGELTKRFSDEFKAQHSEIEWRAIKAMRNIYVHEYDKVNSEQVWKDLTEDVPKLKAQLEQILAAEGENENNNA